MFSSRGVSLFLALKFGSWGRGGGTECWITDSRLLNLGVVSRLGRVEELNRGSGHPGHFPPETSLSAPSPSLQGTLFLPSPATSIFCLQLHVRGGVGRKEKFQRGETSGLPEFKTRPFLSFSPAGFPGMFSRREAWDGALSPLKTCSLVRRERVFFPTSTLWSSTRSYTFGERIHYQTLSPVRSYYTNHNPLKL